MSRGWLDTVSDITVIKAPTGRARCVRCKKLIPYNSVKLSLEYQFYKKSIRDSVTSHRSCCESCSKELLDGRSLKRNLGGSVLHKVSLDLISYYPVRKLLQVEMDEWLGGVV